MTTYELWTIEEPTDVPEGHGSSTVAWSIRKQGSWGGGDYPPAFPDREVAEAWASEHGRGGCRVCRIPLVVEHGKEGA